MLKAGDKVNTDYGSAVVAEVREGEDGPEVGFVIDGHLVWVPEDGVVLL